MSFQFLSRGGTIARRAIRRSERCRRGNAVRTAHDLPGSHPGSNVERRFSKRTVGLALAPLVVGLLAGSVALAQTPAPQTPAAQAPSAKAPAASGAKTTTAPAKSAGSRSRYRLVWGVDSLAVKWAESGEVLRFTYRVLDPNKAKALNDKKNEPVLIDPQAGVKLVVPSMENVGQLRQSAPPEGGKSYWMVFSNKGRLVKRGDHVNVVIGAFHADGLVVD